jgi:regulatory protein
MSGVNEKILNKVRKYCAYQERCQQEVRDKLYDEGLHKADVEAGIALLISEGFINEERFAIAYAGGKFRIKQWGKVKIRLALKSKKVSDYCIRKSLSAISDEDYLRTLKKLKAQQESKVKIKDERIRRYKIAQHLASRGFEQDLVWQVMGDDD